MSFLNFQSTVHSTAFGREDQILVDSSITISEKMEETHAKIRSEIARKRVNPYVCVCVCVRTCSFSPTKRVSASVYLKAISVSSSFRSICTLFKRSPDDVHAQKASVPNARPQTSMYPHDDVPLSGARKSYRPVVSRSF